MVTRIVLKMVNPCIHVLFVRDSRIEVFVFMFSWHVVSRNKCCLSFAYSDPKNRGVRIYVV